MAASGSLRDKHFATGLLKTLGQLCHIEEATTVHCRARATCGEVLGRVDGDVALVYRLNDDEKKRLLIIEREGSGPGNERNILKWFQAVRSNAPISLHGSKNAISSYDFETIELLLAFTRSEGWESSDFRKTVGFCSLLADLINRESERSSIRFIVRVADCSDVVANDGWEQCGEYFGRLIAHRYIAEDALAVE